MGACLGQGEDGDLVLSVIGQVLIEVAEAGRVAAELVIHHPKLIAGRALPARRHITTTPSDTPAEMWWSNRGPPACSVGKGC